MRARPSTGVRALSRTALGALLVTCLGACASLDLERTSPDGGTFRSTAWSFTFLSYDLPAPAISTARANAADSGRPDLVLRDETVIPHLGRFDWLLDVISIRYARVSGTWGEE